MTWVLSCRLPKSRVRWYWCGGGNPKFQDPEYATKYTSFADVRGARRALKEEGMGTFETERLADAKLRYRRRMQRRARAA